ncbi:hypothetical protein V0288_00305 [Pannus brasiliensis CCIBt3594]|uniref:Uncharacterized protein n=1 Tax=Pannus brasiliensis CCIBt3594 TaxID=1427578 RepID=A0AAW9QQK3_9CHRO
MSKARYTDEEIRSILAREAGQELEKLAPDYPIYVSGTEKTIRFGDLPVSEQESLRQALERQARGEIVKLEL